MEEPRVIQLRRRNTTKREQKEVDDRREMERM
jgi:hypothetical protein